MPLKKTLRWEGACYDFSDEELQRCVHTHANAPHAGREIANIMKEIMRRVRLKYGGVLIGPKAHILTMNSIFLQPMTLITANMLRTKHHLQGVAIPLLCLSHAKVSTPLYPF